MATQIIPRGQAADISPIPIPLIMIVAGPVLADSAIF